jgi:hypothetical protein
MDDDYNLDEEAIRDCTRLNAEVMRLNKRNANLESYYFENPGKHFSEDLRWLIEHTWLKENPNCLDQIHEALIRHAKTIKPGTYDVIMEHYRSSHILDLISDLAREVLRRGIELRLVKRLLCQEYKLAKRKESRGY